MKEFGLLEVGAEFKSRSKTDLGPFLRRGLVSAEAEGGDSQMVNH